MRQSLAKLAGVLLVGGCSLIYNPSNITKAGDAAIDSPPDASIDANPNNLSLAMAFPPTLEEGQGEANSRRAILVVYGTNFVTGAQVSLAPTSVMKTLLIDVDNAHAQLSAGADRLAVPVTVHVDPSLHESDNIALTITVAQPVGGSMIMQHLDGSLKLHGHEELTMTNLPSDGAMLATSCYSKVTLANTSALTFKGGQASPVKIRSCSSITIGDINAKGGSTTDGTAGTGGPGGCDGGAPSTDGNCGMSAGKGGKNPSLLTSGGGGGGAGFSAMGSPGAGNGAGTGGGIIGDDMISSYTASFAAGGGGGGIGTAGLNSGGGGGGGGGIVELTAGGDITAGKIDVSGGGGGVAGAGGGGGAGGIIMVRSDHAITSGMLVAAGGLGGTSGATNAGGAGSAGRIRWDSPLANAPSGAVRGPSFVDSTQLFIKTRSLQLIGTPNHKFDVYWNDASGRHNDALDAGTSFDTSGMATISPQLPVGWNHVCITVSGGMQGMPEADKCIDVAYLP